MVNTQKQEYDRTLYLGGFKDGFENANKITAAYASDLLVHVDNIDKPAVRDFIAKLLF